MLPRVWVREACGVRSAQPGHAIPLMKISETKEVISVSHHYEDGFACPYQTVLFGDGGKPVVPGLLHASERNNGRRDQQKLYRRARRNSSSERKHGFNQGICQCRE